MARDITYNGSNGIDRAIDLSTVMRVALLVSVLSYMYYSPLLEMVRTWLNSEAHSHGFLIPAISGYLVWRKRETLGSARLGEDPAGFMLIFGGIALYLAGSLAFEAFTTLVSFLLILAGLVYLLLGKHIFRTLAFPLGYLFFMIPVPHIIMKGVAVKLKHVYAKITYSIVSSLGIPIVREGVYLELPNAKLIIADFCAGVLSIIAILAISVFYAYRTQRTAAGAAALVILSVPCALLSNTFRLVVTVVLTYYFGETVLDTAFHQFHGMFNFIITIALVVAAGKAIAIIEGKAGKELRVT